MTTRLSHLSAAVILTLVASAPAFAQEELTRLAHKGMDLIKPYVILSDSSHDEPYTDKDPRTDQARADIREGIAILEQVTAQRPNFWPGLLLIGMGHQTGGDHPAAYQAFKRAYELNPPEQSGISREYALEALCTHHDDEAVMAARKAAAAHPDDAVLAANLGYVMLGVVGQLDAAEEATKRSLRLAPSDPMTQGQLRDIIGVRAGTVLARRCYP